MSTDTATQQTPDLSALTPTERLNIAVAITQGGHFVRIERADAWVVDMPEGRSAWIYDDGESYAMQNIPNYAGDPSAWGALMEKEGVWSEPVYDYAKELPVLSGWMGRWVEETESDWCAGCTSVDCPSLGLAVCAAVLQKHGVDPTPYIGD